MAISKYAIGKALRSIAKDFTDAVDEAAREAAEEVMDLVKRKLYEYTRSTIYATPESPVYDPRTGQFLKAITGKLIKRKDQYYINIYFDENKWDAIHRDPPQMNAHADMKMNKIDDRLVGILEERYGFWEETMEWIDRYANEELTKRIHIKLKQTYKSK